MTTYSVTTDFFPNQHFITHEIKDLWYFEWAGLLREKHIERGDRLNVEVEIPLLMARRAKISYLFEMFITDVNAEYEIGSLEMFTIKGRSVSEVAWSVHDE